MSALSRHHWRIAIVSLAVCSSVLLSLGYTYASGAQVDASQQFMAQSAATTLKQINSDPFTNPDSNHKTQVEPASFSFGNTIVTAMQTGRFFDGGASDIAFSTSTDGGKTWLKGTLPATVFSGGPYPRASDPSVAYDARHKVWLISYLGIKTPNTADVNVSRSTDGGKTFSAPIIISSQGTDLLDKNWTTCDNGPRSPFYGHCYTEFDNFSQLNLVQISTSTDGGATWGAPKTTPDETCVIGGQPLVQPNGTVIMPISDCFESVVLSIRSTDGGETWSEPSFVGQEIFFGPAGNLRAGGLISASMDGAGKVYVTWIDCRREFRCTSGVDDLMLSTSSDGRTWSVPRRIPIAPVGSTVEPMLPGLGIDPKTSGDSAHIGLVYYFYPNAVTPDHNFFCSTDTCQLEVGFISSTNGGRTWSSPQTLAGPMKLRWLPLTTQGYMVGDYFATSVLSGQEGEGSTAFPIFMVASAPTPPDTTCSNKTTGAPGQHCNQPTFTIANGIAIGGGNGGDTGNQEGEQGETSPSASAQAKASGAFHLEVPERSGSPRARSSN
jgi:hypothetical protein